MRTDYTHRGPVWRVVGLASCCTQCSRRWTGGIMRDGVLTNIGDPDCE
jgi:hypothetical protein